MAAVSDAMPPADLLTSSQNVTLVSHYGPRLFISHEAFTTYIFVSVIICEGVSLLGAVTNIINIIVFVKLGLRETTSISMLSLAVSDLLIASLALWSNLLYLPQFQNLGLPLRLDDVFIFSGGVTRQFVARTSALITTFITMERCLCVMLPLKVKDIITRTRTIVVMITIFIITLGPSLFIYGNYRIGWYFYPDVNRTLLGTRYVDGQTNNIVDRIVSSIIGSILLQGSFVATCICTIYLVVHLRRASKFRKSHSRGIPMGKKLNQICQAETTIDLAIKRIPETNNQRVRVTQSFPTSKSNSKEDRVARTVVIIAAVFIVSFTPGCVAFMLYVCFPGFTLYGIYAQLFRLVFTAGYITEAINSSVNLFIYYNMATNFRNMVDQMFGREEKKSLILRENVRLAKNLE